MDRERPVAVVGGAGFIGLRVCRELRARGFVPWVLDTFRHGTESRRAAQDIAGAVARVDAREVEPVASAIKGQSIPILINLATVSVRESLGDPCRAAANISAIGAAVPEACALAGVGRYVYVSSSEVYGEAAEGPLHESCVPRPCTVYGAAKLAGEHYAEVTRLRHGLEVVIVRPFNAYGPGAHIGGAAGEAIPRWIAQAARGDALTIHGDGQQTRDYTCVEDLARGIVDAALSDATVNTGPINLCSGVERSALSVARDVAGLAERDPMKRAVGPTGQPRPCDLRRQVGSAARAATLLGWSLRVSWEDGLRRTREDVLARLAAGESADVPERTWA